MKFLPGIAVGAASGSMGGVTASHNRGGQYFRRRAVPDNPLSAFSSTVRASWGNLSSMWRTLDEEQQAAWNAAALSISILSVIGTTVQPTGQQLFIRTNQRTQLYLGGDPVELPPASWDVASPTALAITEASFDTPLTVVLELTLAPTTIPANHIVLVRATPGLSLGLSNVKKYFRTLGSIEPTVGVVDYGDLWLARFGIPTIDTRVWVQLGFLNVTNGQVSEYLLAQALWTGAP